MVRKKKDKVKQKAPPPVASKYPVTQITVEVIEPWENLRSTKLPDPSVVAGKQFQLWKKIANKTIKFLEQEKVLLENGDVVELTPKTLLALATVVEKIQANMFALLEKDAAHTTSKISQDEKRILYVEGLTEDEI